MKKKEIHLYWGIFTLFD